MKTLTKHLVAVLLGTVYAASGNSLAADTGASCKLFASDLRDFESLTAESGSFSRSTGERLSGAAFFAQVYLEGYGGEVPAGFGTNPQRMFVFTTESGRIVVRFFDWAGAY